MVGAKGIQNAMIRLYGKRAMMKSISTGLLMNLGARGGGVKGNPNGRLWMVERERAGKRERESERERGRELR